MPNADKIILDLCGGTGAWSIFYKLAGYVVYVITLPDYDVTKWHIDGLFIVFEGQGGADDIRIEIAKIYGILAAPPCTQFSFAKTTGKPRDLRQGMEIVSACLNIIWEVQYNLKSDYAKTTNLKFWALENPYSIIRRFLGHPLLIFNPYDYGNPWQKKTGVWGFFNIPKQNPIKLNPIEKALAYRNSIPLKNRIGKTGMIKMVQMQNPRTIIKNNDTKGLGRADIRAITPKGFANAFFKANR